jgi:hypothetical protein
MTANGIDPRETAKVLKALLGRKVLTEEQFRHQHHLGGSTRAFLRYCSKVRSFQPGGKNEEMHEWLISKL